MKIAIIGGGASGVLAAILIKKENIDHDVYIFEHENKLLKKLLATGNGRCNLGNAKIDISKYRNKDFAKNILKGYNVKQTFSELGIEIKNIDNLYYPYSESSQSVYNVLIDNLEKGHVKIHLEENIIDYKSTNDKIELLTNKNKYEFDRLLIAVGGVSYPKLGSDGSFIDIIKKHNYKFDEFKPGLVALKTKQNNHMLSGTRAKCQVLLYKDNIATYKEMGEVIFKDEGLGGIVIMNISNIIANEINANYALELDFIPDVKEEDMIEYISSYGKEAFFNAYLHPNIVKFFLKNNINPLFVKRLIFNVKGNYGFDNAQISVGGIEVDQITDNLESKIEKNVYFLGEIINVNGPCGGYNLTFAFACGNKLKNLK